MTLKKLHGVIWTYRYCMERYDQIDRYEQFVSWRLCLFSSCSRWLSANLIGKLRYEI